MLKTIAFMSLILTFTASANSDFDKIDELNGVSLKSVKENTVRTYLGSMEKTIPLPIEIVRSGVTNFTEKCNNSYKDKREFTSIDFDCKYHNENIVESFVVKDIRQMDYFKGLTEVYLLGRQIYNRSKYGYYELVTVQEEKQEKNVTSVIVELRMLSDKEAMIYTSPKFERESPFDQSLSRFKLTRISPSETHLSYSYSASTDHWLLNKEISVPQVFVSISKSINELVNTIEDEAYSKKRKLASKE